MFFDGRFVEVFNKFIWINVNGECVYSDKLVVLVDVVGCCWGVEDVGVVVEEVVGVVVGVKVD